LDQAFQPFSKRGKSVESGGERKKNKPVQLGERDDEFVNIHCSKRFEVTINQAQGPRNGGKRYIPGGRTGWEGLVGHLVGGGGRADRHPGGRQSWGERRQGRRPTCGWKTSGERSCFEKKGSSAHPFADSQGPPRNQVP